MEALIRAAIRNVVAGATIRCCLTEVGWLIEAFHASLADQAQIDAVATALNQIPYQANNPFIVWKLFLYTNDIERFGVVGTLHTQEPTWENGVETVVLSGMDCYINIPELDAELMTLINYNGLTIEAVETLSERTGQPIMEFRGAGVNYLWLEALGDRYGVANAQLLAGNAVPRRVTLVLANPE